MTKNELKSLIKKIINEGDEAKEPRPVVSAEEFQFLNNELTVQNFNTKNLNTKNLNKLVRIAKKYNKQSNLFSTDESVDINDAIKIIEHLEDSVNVIKKLLLKKR